MVLVKCLECGHNISDKAKMCPNCGIALGNKKSLLCPECGSLYIEDDNLCKMCGFPLNNNIKESTQEQKKFNIYWKGRNWFLIDVKVVLTVNDVKIGTYSMRKGFLAKIPIENDTIRICLTSSIGIGKAYYELDICSKKNYEFSLIYDNFSGFFGEKYNIKSY